MPDNTTVTLALVCLIALGLFVVVSATKQTELTITPQTVLENNSNDVLKRLILNQTQMEKIKEPTKMSVYTGINLCPIPATPISDSWQTDETFSHAYPVLYDLHFDDVIKRSSLPSIRIDPRGPGSTNTVREAGYAPGIGVSVGQHIVYQVWLRISKDCGDQLGGKIGIDFYSDHYLTGISFSGEYTYPTPYGQRVRDETVNSFNGGAWQLRTIDFTMPALVHCDNFESNGHPEYEPANTMVPWVMGSIVGDGADTQVWFADPALYINPSTTNAHVITATAGSGASVSPSGNIPVSDNGSQTFNWSAATGYRVNQVLIDGSPYGYPDFGSYTFSSVTGNHSIVVSAVPIVLTISASAGANCTISPTGAQQVYYGNNKTFTITTADGNTLYVLVDGVPV